MKRAVKRTASQVLQDRHGQDIALPSRYADREGAVRGFHPPPASQLRLAFFGPVGEGKSHFGVSISRACILDLENKTTGIEDRFWAPGTQAFHLPTAAAYEELFKDLITDAGKGKRPFDVIVFDVLNCYIDMVRIWLTGTAGMTLITRDGGRRSVADAAKQGLEGAGWAQINNYVNGQLDALYRAGYGWLALAHQHKKNVTTVDGQHKTIWESAVNPGILKHLFREAEFIGEISRGIGRDLAPSSDGGKVKATRRTVYSLVLDPNKAKLPTRIHLPLAETMIPLRRGQGWDAFKDQYDQAVQAAASDPGR